MITILYSLFVLCGIFMFPELILALVLLNAGYVFLAVVAFLAVYAPGFRVKGKVFIDRQWHKIKDRLEK